MPIKEYLGAENARNKKHAALYTDLIRRAFGKGQDVLVGHHLTFEEHGHIESENEIPSADTLLFCHDLMGRVFGADQAISLMRILATLPVDGDMREQLVADTLYEMDSKALLNLKDGK